MLYDIHVLTYLMCQVLSPILITVLSFTLLTYKYIQTLENPPPGWFDLRVGGHLVLTDFIA